MPRLYRPHVPLEVRCRVALRQLGVPCPDLVIAANLRQGSALHRRGTRSLGVLLEDLLDRLAPLLGCEVADLRLDHFDPPLAARVILAEGVKNGRRWATYFPDANDPEHLMYRPHGPQFAGSHVVKTRVRGDHGQHPDLVLIKRERKRVRALSGRAGQQKRAMTSASKKRKSPGPKWLQRIRRRERERRRQLPLPPRRGS